MRIYSHPLFYVQGRDFPDIEHPDRFRLLLKDLEHAERVFFKGDEENLDLIERIERLHSYKDELLLLGPGFQTIDKEKETFIDRLSYRTACAAAATSIYAAQAEGFALVRPSGHHAHRTFTHGFCLLNNMALAVDALEEDGERILVLDLDIHHGCGTEELLAGKENTRMISLYKKNFWPMGSHFSYAENCIHFPLREGVTDTQYLQVFEKKVLPEIEKFHPSIIGVSIGFDTFAEEKFGWKLSTRTIHKIRKLLKGKRLFGILEGGYTEKALRNGVRAFIEDP